MSTLIQDFRYAFRTLLKSRGFTALAVIALALGIGANTAIFSVADAFLRKPVAFPHLDRIVMLFNRVPVWLTGLGIRVSCRLSRLAKAEPVVRANRSVRMEFVQSDGEWRS